MRKKRILISYEENLETNTFTFLNGITELYSHLPQNIKVSLYSNLNFRGEKNNFLVEYFKNYF